MPLYDNFLELAGTKAKIANLEADTQDKAAQGALRLAQADAYEKNAKVDEATRAAAKKAQDAEDAAAKANAPVPVADQDPLTQQITAAQKDIKAQTALAAEIRRSGGDQKLADQAMDAANRARDTLFHNMNLKFTADKEKAKDLAAAAGSVAPDGSNVRQVVAQVERVAPGWTKNMDLDTDLMGNVVWGKKTQKALATTQQQGVTAKDQLELQHKALLAKMTAEENARKAKADQQRAIDSDRRDSLARDKLEVDRERLSDTKEERAARRAEREAKAADKTTKERTPKAPTEGAVKALVPALAKEFELSAEDAALAARDYAVKVEEQLAKGDSREAAEAAGLELVRSRHRPGQKSTKKFFGLVGEDGKPATYQKFGEAKPGGYEEGTPETAIALDKAKVPFSMEGGVYKFTDAAKADAGIALLPKGTVFVGPDGKKYKKK